MASNTIQNLLYYASCTFLIYQGQGSIRGGCPNQYSKELCSTFNLGQEINLQSQLHVFVSGWDDAITVCFMIVQEFLVPNLPHPLPIVFPPVYVSIPLRASIIFLSNVIKVSPASHFWHSRRCSRIVFTASRENRFVTDHATRLQFRLTFGADKRLLKIFQFLPPCFTSSLLCQSNAVLGILHKSYIIEKTKMLVQQFRTVPFYSRSVQCVR